MEHSQVKQAQWLWNAQLKWLHMAIFAITTHTSRMVLLHSVVNYSTFGLSPVTHSQQDIMGADGTEEYALPDCAEHHRVMWRLQHSLWTQLHKTDTHML